MSTATEALGKTTKTRDEESLEYIKVGNSHLAQKSPDKALEAYRSALALTPRNGFAYHNTGAALLMMNTRESLAAASTSFLTATLLQPKNEQFRISYITSLHQLGLRGRAKRSTIDALEEMGRTPRLVETLQYLDAQGVSAHAPIERLTKSIPKGRFEKLDRLMANKQYDQLESEARALAEQAPNSPRAWLYIYNVARVQDRMIEAEAAIRHMVVLEPHNVEFIIHLIGALRSSGKSDAALFEVRAAIHRLEPNVRLYRAGVEVALSGEKKSDAIALGRAAVDAFPQSADAYWALGDALAASDKDEEAAKTFLKGIEVEPRSETPYRCALSYFDRTTDTDRIQWIIDTAAENGVEFTENTSIHMIARYKARLGEYQEAYDRLKNIYDPALFDYTTGQVAMTLGRCADRLGHYDEAFSAFTHGNRIDAKIEYARGAVHPKKYSDRLDGCRRWLEMFREDSSVYSKPDAASSDEPKVAFIVGFPRSGTTLLDTILRSHSSIEVVEERPLLVRTMREAAHRANLPRITQQDDIFKAFFDTDRNWLRSTYFKLLGEYTENDVSSETVYIDKLPLNLAYASHLKYMFPNALFIFAQRDPLDSVLSCYMQDFKINDAMFHFTDLEMAGNLYNRVMGLWFDAVDILGIDPTVVQYERLVDDLESQVGPVIERLGLGWDDRVKNYIETARSRGRINTPSATQVTQPLYKSARERWRRYRSHLEPIIPILQPWREKLGYGPIDPD